MIGFTRTKKLVFVNNKGGVGKTTLAYNTAVKFAEKGLKTVLIDLDPQCNLSALAMGKEFLMQNLFTESNENIFGVVEPIIRGTGLSNNSINFTALSKNLSILPGSLQLSQYENSLISSWGEAAQGNERGFNQTSAIDRFLNKKGLEENIDIFIIDTSPSLGLLNRIIFLGSDYFITPMMPDQFSLQGIENLGTTFKEWKENWRVTAKVLGKSKGISSDKILDGDGLFIGYVVNSYNQYAKQPIIANKQWIEKIPIFVKKYLSENHGRNGLVQQSYEKAIATIKDFGQFSPISQQKNKAVFNLEPIKDFKNVKGALNNLEQAKADFNELSENIYKILKDY